MNYGTGEYKGGRKIISVSFSEEMNEEFQKEKLDFVYVAPGKTTLYSGEESFLLNRKQSQVFGDAHECDVYKIEENGNAEKCFDSCSSDNFFFVTPKCNSNCIMCPSSDYSRKQNSVWSVDDLIEIARHIPEEVEHLTITGGEPFMAGPDLFRFFGFLKAKFHYTDFLLLTNGRIFAVDSFTERLCNVIPDRCTVAIPLHGSCAEIHDRITQAPGSFRQTLAGIKALLRRHIKVEIRLVVSALNIDDLSSVVSLIVREFPGTEYVSIIAMEMTGSARIHRNEVWLPYSEAGRHIEDPVRYLIHNGMDVRLYNFPLCSVSKELWPLCCKSISDNKIRFAENCSCCRMKPSCGGVFAGTLLLEKGDLKPIA